MEQCKSYCNRGAKICPWPFSYVITFKVCKRSTASLTELGGVASHWHLSGWPWVKWGYILWSPESQLIGCWQDIRASDWSRGVTCANINSMSGCISDQDVNLFWISHSATFRMYIRLPSKYYWSKNGVEEKDAVNKGPWKNIKWVFWHSQNLINEHIEYHKGISWQNK